MGRAKGVWEMDGTASSVTLAETEAENENWREKRSWSRLGSDYQSPQLFLVLVSASPALKETTARPHIELAPNSF